MPLLCWCHLRLLVNAAKAAVTACRAGRQTPSLLRIIFFDHCCCAVRLQIQLLHEVKAALACLWCVCYVVQSCVACDQISILSRCKNLEWEIGGALVPKPPKYRGRSPKKIHPRNSTQKIHDFGAHRKWFPSKTALQFPENFKISGSGWDLCRLKL